MTRKLTEEQIAFNIWAVEDAIAQQTLEGLTVSPETVEDFYRAARGEIDNEEVLRNIYQRFAKVPYPGDRMERRRKWERRKTR